MFSFNREAVELQSVPAAPPASSHYPSDPSVDEFDDLRDAPAPAEHLPRPLVTASAPSGVARPRRYHLVGTHEPVEGSDGTDDASNASGGHWPVSGGLHFQRESHARLSEDSALPTAIGAQSDVADSSGPAQPNMDGFLNEGDRRQLSPPTPPTAADGTSSERRQFYCPTCSKTVISEVSFTPSIWTFVIGFFAFVVFGWLALCIVPFLWPLSQIVIHKCQLCQQVLSEHRRVSCFRHREEIFTLRAGNCAVVLSKRYVFASLIMLALIFCILLLRRYLLEFGLPELAPGAPSGATWTEFLEDCGTRSLLGNPIKAQRLFADHYSDRTVRWRGRVHHVQEGILRTHFLYIDMAPPYYSRDDWRDIAMTFGKRLTPTVEDLDPGDEIEFEATLLDLGRRGRPLLAMLWDLNVTGRAEELPLYRKQRSAIVVLQDMLAPPVRLPQLIVRQIGVPEQTRPLTPERPDAIEVVPTPDRIEEVPLDS